MQVRCQTMAGLPHFALVETNYLVIRLHEGLRLRMQVRGQTMAGLPHCALVQAKGNKNNKKQPAVTISTCPSR